MRIEGLSIIYKITSPSGKVYIGQTVNWQKRFTYYKNGNAKGQIILYNSINKYGWDAHKVELIQYFPLSEINQAEIAMIIKYNSYYKDSEFGMNMTKGGDRTPFSRIGKDHHSFGRIVSDKERERMKQLNLGKKMSEEFKEKLRFSNLGKKMSPEAIQKTVDASSKPILQYSLFGDYIQTWKSAAEASRALKISLGNIRSCVKEIFGHIHAGNFIWKPYIENFPIKIPKVLTYDTINILVTNLSNSESEIIIGYKNLRSKLDIEQKLISEAFRNNGIISKLNVKIQLLESYRKSLADTKPIV